VQVVFFRVRKLWEKITFVELNTPASRPSNDLSDRSLSVWQNAGGVLFLADFSNGKTKALQINSTRRLCRMLFHTLCFGRDPGTSLSAVRSGQSPMVMGRPQCNALHGPAESTVLTGTWL